MGYVYFFVLNNSAEGRATVGLTMLIGELTNLVQNYKLPSGKQNHYTFSEKVRLINLLAG